jgi:hypothetical protein
MTSFAERGAALPDPIGAAIDRAAAAAGVDPKWMRTYAAIESGGQPTARTGGYYGLFQLSKDEYARYGTGTNIFDVADNSLAAAYSLKDRIAKFKSQNGRDPSVTELYLAHQQGDGGLAAHMAHPDQPAWMSMAGTGEGKQKGAGWAKLAVWGNVPTDMRAGLNVDTMTSRQFMDIWAHKVEGGAYTAPSGAPPVDDNGKPAATPQAPAYTPGPYDSYVRNQSFVDSGAGTNVSNYQFDHNVTADVRPPDPYTATEVADRAKGPQSAYSNIFDTASAAAQSDWATSWALRELGSGAVDPNWDFNLNRFKEVTKGVPENYHEFIADAHSEADLASRLKYVQEDTVRQSKLAAGGFNAVGIRLLTDLVDPTNIAATVLSDGAGSLVAVARASRIGRIMLDAGLAGAANAGATAATAQVNPTVSEGDIVQAFGFGAFLGGTLGGLRRNPATAFEGAQMANMGRSIMDPTLAPAGPSSGGAAATPGLRQSLLTGTRPVLDQADAPFALGGSIRLDSVGKLGSSKSPLARVLSSFFGEEAVGTKGHGVIPDAATTIQREIHQQHIANWQTVAYPAFAKWAKDTGRWARSKRAAAWEDFHSQVTDYVETKLPQAGTHPSISSAAGEFRRLMADYKGLIDNPLRDRGGQARPMAELDDNANYVPLYGNQEVINEKINLFGMQRLQTAATQAMLKVIPDLKPELADRLGKLYMNRLVSAGYGMEDGIALAVKNADKDALKDLLQNAVNESHLKFTDVEVDQLMEQIDGMGVRKEGSTGTSRLRRRTIMDYHDGVSIMGNDGQLHPFKMRDLFVKDADFLMNRYSRQMSGRIALAQMQVRNPRTGELILNGIYSKGDFDKLANWVRDEWHTMAGDLSHDARDSGAKADVANLQYLHDAITGTPRYATWEKSFQWMKRFRDFNFLRLMNRLGLNQAQEFMTMMGTLGVKAMWQQIPSFRRITNEMGRSVPQDRLLQELEAVTGRGTERDFGHHRFRYEDELMGKSTGGAFTRWVDDKLEKGKRFTADYSLMTHVHSLQQKWTIKTVAQRLHDMAVATKVGDTFDLQRLPGKELSKLRSIGMADADLQRVFGHLLQHGETPEGSRLVSLNLDKWAPEVRARFVSSMLRWTDRVIQQNDPGTLARWMSNPVAQMMTQFRTFIIGAWAKKTLYGLHHFDARTFATWALELMAGAATWQIVNFGSNVFHPEKALERSTLDNMAKAAFSRSGWTSLVPGAVDTAASFLPWGPAFDFRSSGAPQDFLFGSIGGDFAKSASTFTKGLINAAAGRGLTQGTISAGSRMLPFGNWLPTTAVLGALTHDLPTQVEPVRKSTH